MAHQPDSSPITAPATQQIASLLGGNLVPDADELLIIRQLLANAETDMADVDVRIAELTRSLKGLKSNRRYLAELVTSHRVILSPIRKISSETLKGIFSFLTPPNHHSSNSTFPDALAISHVYVAADFLQRSHQHPLSVIIHTHPFSFQPLDTTSLSVLSAFMSCSARLHSIELDIPPESYSHMLHITHFIPLLRCLKLASSSGHPVDAGTTIAIFADSPSLCELRLESPLSPDSFEIPWAQITDCTFIGQSHTDIMATFPKITNVRTLELRGLVSSEYREEAQTHTKQFVTFPDATSLTISDISAALLETTLGTIHAPYLRSLTLQRCDATEHRTRLPFISLLATSNSPHHCHPVDNGRPCTLPHGHPIRNPSRHYPE
ncbi:hypothetical protein HGRIS_001352 [Hohenbuehelia grisea]|uniref:F-box domain-containing protein n=1 Tax=Hohenbuehelia grisea TaxID=104357 RepID=A0ABR3JP90_9AGAR